MESNVAATGKKAMKNKWKSVELMSILPDSYPRLSKGSWADEVEDNEREDMSMFTDKPVLPTAPNSLRGCENIIKYSVIPPGLEKQRFLPSYDEGKRLSRRKRKMEREQTAGSEWFNIKAPEMTEEIRNNLDVLKMRSALDPKSFKKRNDLKVLPKHFQIGRVAGSSGDFYSSRIPKKEQKETLVEELLADAEFQKNTKKKLKKIIMSKK